MVRSLPDAVAFGAVGTHETLQIVQDGTWSLAATFSMSRFTFDSGKSGAVADSILASVASFRPSVVMARALSIRGSTLCDRSLS